MKPFSRRRGPRRKMSRLGSARLRAGIGITYLVGLVLAAFLAPLPYDPTIPDPAATDLAPSLHHWFGTDGTGFDVFSRTIASARTDVPIAVAGVLIAGAVGTPLGVLLSIQGKISEVVMRLLDLFQALPLLIVAIVIVAISGSGGDIDAVIVAIALVNTPLFIRLVRAESLTVRSRRFIEAAEGFGASLWRVSFRHVLPNIAPIALAQASISSGFAIILIAALGFLGIGIHPPTPDWGSMINAGAAAVGNGYWWLLAYPAIAISATVISLNLIAEGARGILAHRRGTDPRQTVRGRLAAALARLGSGRPPPGAAAPAAARAR